MIRSRIERSKAQCVLKSRSKGTTAKAQSRSREGMAISSQSKYSAITGKRCAGVKDIRGGMNPFLVFSVYDQQSYYLCADTKPDFAESSVSAIAIPSPVYDFPAIATLWEGTPHGSELSRDDLQATSYERWIGRRI